MYVLILISISIFFLICCSYKNILNFIVYTELFWMFTFFLLISCASFFDDSRFFVLAFLFLFLATLEVISFSLVLLLKFK